MGKKAQMRQSVKNGKRNIFLLLLLTGHMISFTQSSTFSGIVKNKHSLSPLSGVTISEPKFGKTAVSDEKGIFSINLEAGTDSLIIKALGFTTRIIKMEKDKELIVFLEPEYLYSETDRQYLSRQLEGKPISSSKTGNPMPQHALSGFNGRTSALIINSWSGSPGEEPFLQIRGVNSMIFNQSPVILLDGTPIDKISDINVNDVSDISVLNQTSSLSILGGQGANGAVLIRTKRGEIGKNRVNFSAAYGVQSLEKDRDMLSPAESAKTMNELNTNLVGTPDDKTVYFGNDFFSDSLVNLSNPYNNDWQKELFSSAPFQNYNLSFSGGTEETRFIVSASYTNMKGIIAPSQSKRMNISLNLDHIISEKLSIGTSMYLAKINNRNIFEIGSAEEGNVILSALAYPSFLPGKDEEGKPFINPLRPGIDNPIANREGHEDSFSRNSAIASFFMNYKILDGLILQLNTSGNLALDRRDYFASTYKTYLGRINSGYGIQSGREITSWNSEALLNYNKSTESIDFDLIGGALFYKARNAWNSAEGWGFPTDGVKELSGAGTVQSTSNMNDYSRAAYLSRLCLDFEGKYQIRANIRAEKSSRFSDKSETGIFYGLNGSWILTEENFLSGNNVLNHLQINLGYGLTGNDGGNIAGLLYPLFATDTIPPLSPDEIHTEVEFPGAGFPSRNIQDQTWEKTSELNAGITSGLFGNKVLFSASWYSRSITDLILPDLSPSSIVYVNGGELTSHGLEASLSLQNMSDGSFNWVPALYFNQSKNEVVSTGNLGNGYLLGYNGNSNIIKEGEALYAFWGYEVEGIFQEQADIDNHALQAGAERGDLMYKNRNTDNVIDEKDKAVIGDPNPDFYLGFDNSFKFNGFEFNILFQGAFGAERLNLVKMQTEGVNDFINMSSEVANRWTPGSGENKIPRASAGTNNTLLSDRFIEKADFFRLKQINLGYNVPSSSLEKLGISSTYVYLTGSNLITFTNYSGYDPESSSYDILGIDYGAYPNARSIGCGIKLSF